MSEKTKTYEAMFLLDSGQPSFEVASEPVRGILTRRGADILALKPWDERKLAFEIRGRKRGLYVLAYFKVDPLMVVEIEHDCRLDERVIRSLFLRKDKLTPEQINAETPATSAGHRPPDAAPGEAAPGEPGAPAAVVAPGAEVAVAEAGETPAAAPAPETPAEKPPAPPAAAEGDQAK